jgi:hypothetical protein
VVVRIGLIRRAGKLRLAVGRKGLRPCPSRAGNAPGLDKVKPKPSSTTFSPVTTTTNRTTTTTDQFALVFNLVRDATLACGLGVGGHFAQLGEVSDKLQARLSQMDHLDQVQQHRSSQATHSSRSEHQDNSYLRRRQAGGYPVGKQQIRGSAQ